MNGWWQLMKYQNFPLSEFPFYAGWICFFIAHDICEGNGVVMVTSFIIGGKWNLEYHTFLWSGSPKSLGWIIRWEALQLPYKNVKDRKFLFSTHTIEWILNYRHLWRVWESWFSSLKTFSLSFIIPWRVHIVRLHLKSLFFLPLYHIYLYLFTIIHFFQNRNGDQSQIQLSQDTLETFSWDSQECMNLCIYCILHIAHLCSYCIVFLWFWLIMWGEFLGRVLDWNVKTNQWQIAWTHSNWHL